jgi:subtilisin family serine protease
MQDSTDKHYTGLAAAVGMTSMSLLLLVTIGLLAGSTGWAKSPVQTVSGDTLQDFIIQLDQPGAATVDSFAPAYQALRANGRSAAGSSTALKLYLQGLQDQRHQVLADAVFEFRRALSPSYEYQHLLNGFAIAMTASEAAAMAAMPGVISVTPSRSYQLHLDAGPGLIGAPSVWNGSNGIAARGEGVVIGIIDSGINWQHPFFGESSADGFVFSNPHDSQLGLCSNPEVQCNNKLIGVYDFTTEGEQIGRDLNGHGRQCGRVQFFPR